MDVVNDGQAALEALANTHYDVLLCDLIMPRMDGFELLERLGSGLIEDPPAVIVVSAMRHEDCLLYTSIPMKDIRLGQQPAKLLATGLIPFDDLYMHTGFQKLPS